MDFMKDVRESELYKNSIRGLSEEEIKQVERELEALTGPLSELANHIQSLAADDKGFFEMIDAIAEVTTAKEVKKWHEKS